MKLWIREKGFRSIILANREEGIEIIVSENGGFFQITKGKVKYLESQKLYRLRKLSAKAYFLEGTNHQLTNEKGNIELKPRL